MIERGGRAGKEGVRRPCASGVEDQCSLDEKKKVCHVLVSTVIGPRSYGLQVAAFFQRW